jgi:hypothetical protein
MAQAARQDWRTPDEVVELLHVLWEGGPDIDPCAAPERAHHLAKENFDGRDIFTNGLECTWPGRAYVNPPFADLALWAEKCRREHEQRGAEVVLLMPARTDTAYWHQHVATADAVCFWRGRMRFIGAPSSAPFPTALAYWGPRPWDFHRVFASKGLVVRP